MQSDIGKRELLELRKVSKNFDRDMQKVKKGYPIQYLIGYVDFYNSKILVNKNVLIPRPETEYLVEKVVNYVKRYNFNNPDILDLCTGSGAIGIALKKEIKSNVTESDISIKALNVAKKNAKLNNLDIEFIKSDLFKNINNKYDVIVSNPPYVSLEEVLPDDVLNEPKEALFSPLNGMHHILEIIKMVNKYTKDKSLIAIEINSYDKSLIETEVKKYFNNYSFETDLTGKIRYLFIFKNCE